MTRIEGIGPRPSLRECTPLTVVRVEGGSEPVVQTGWPVDHTTSVGYRDPTLFLRAARP